MEIRLKNLLTLLLILFLLICGIITNNILFFIILIIWSLIFRYSYIKIYKRTVLCFFLVSFFVFLIGRDLVQYIFYYKIQDFPLEINNHAYISLILSLMVLFIGYSYFSRYKLKFKKKIKKKINRKKFEKINKIFYYTILIISYLSEIVTIKYVCRYGYTEYYISFHKYLVNNKILYLFNKLEYILPLIFSFYIACFSNKKQTKKVIITYIIYLIITLGIGYRSKFIIGFLLIFIYFIKRQYIFADEIWIKKKYLYLLLGITPVLLLFFEIYSNFRFRETLEINSFFQGLLNFFYKQGVTINTIKRGYQYRSYISEITDCYFTLEFLKSGWIARILNVEVFNGNNIEHALYGGSYNHTLSYVVLNNLYLKGRGIGSSYIAELYQDFGYVGIIVGNLFYSYILAKVDKILISDSPIINGIKFFIIPILIWSIRSSFSGILTALLAPLTCVYIIVIYLRWKISFNYKKSLKSRRL